MKEMKVKRKRGRCIAKTRVKQEEEEEEEERRGQNEVTEDGNKRKERQNDKL